MSLASISEYYTLSEIVVCPQQLVLDPCNPRIVTDGECEIYEDVSILISEDTQKTTFDKLLKSEYDVKKLIESISKKGFIQGQSELIVRSIANTGKYLVLEGNRRTTAIRHILGNTGAYDSSVISTLQYLKVKEFKYIKNNEYAEEDIVDIILGSIHVSGNLEWGAMERAHYIYKTYSREYKKHHGVNFVQIDEEIITKICSYYEFSTKEVKNLLQTYLAYSQLRYNNFPVKPDRFSLLRLSIERKDLRDNFFQINEDYRVSEVGLERFYELFIKKPHIISNPSDFRQFATVFADGNDLVDDVLSRRVKLDDAYAITKARKSDNKTCDDLESILRKLQAIKLISVIDNKCELNLCQQIIEIVNSKFTKVVNTANHDSFGAVSYDNMPRNIDEALKMTEKQLSAVILATLRERPNSTCVKDKLCDYVLNYLNIITRREPRKLFMNKVMNTTKGLVASGQIQEYVAKNVRLRANV